jgi:hypothetical protein
MLDSVLSVESCSSSSSSDPSSSESVMASPPPVPDMLILVGLHDILEMPEDETAHQVMEPVETRPHPETFAGTFSHIL